MQHSRDVRVERTPFLWPKETKMHWGERPGRMFTTKPLKPSPGQHGSLSPRAWVQIPSTPWDHWVSSSNGSLTIVFLVYHREEGVLPAPSVVVRVSELTSQESEEWRVPGVCSVCVPVYPSVLARLCTWALCVCKYTYTRVCSGSSCVYGCLHAHEGCGHIPAALMSSPLDYVSVL